MTSKELGILLRNNPSEVRVEWSSLIFDLAEFVGQALILAPTAGGSAPDMLSKAFSALKNVSLNDPIETRAFGLFALSVATALENLIPQRGLILSVSMKKLSVEVSGHILREVQSFDHVMSANFFQSPVENSLYRAIRPGISKIIANARGQKASSDLSAKFDSAFSSAVFRVWQTRSDYFSPILERLSNPGERTAQLQIDWTNYRANLIEKFNVSPVFGQMEYKASLSDIYIELDGVYQVEDEEGDVVEHRVHLHEAINEWLDIDDPSDAVRLIFGGPGSGKSSFAKAMASSLASRADKRPIFVELQHSNALGDLRQAIEQKLVVDHEIFSSDPLSERDENRRFVLIFDGLDELVVPGSAAASRVADGFVASLRALLRSLNSGGKCRAKVLVTGRTTVMQSFAKSLEAKGHMAYEIKGFISEGQEDLRPKWWKKFALAYKQDLPLPEALKTKELEDVTNEPLLCFLLALSGYLTGNWTEAAENTNRIYDRLIGEVWERRWGESAGGSGRVGPAQSLRSKADFDLLMETMALAAWWGGESRVATKASFDRALSATGATEVWSKFVADEGDDLANLALTFYFRRAEVESQGFEFTHKTFGEYLVARFLMKQATAKLALPLRGRDIDKAEASERWCRYAVNGAPHHGITSFLRNEARLVSADLIEVSIQEIQGWFSYVVAHGLPINRRSNEEFRILERLNNNGQANIMACLSALARAKDSKGDSLDWNVELDWSGETVSQCETIRRISNLQTTPNRSDVDFYRVSFASPEAGLLTGLFLPDASFERTNWTRLTMANLYFGSTNLFQADFSSSLIMDVGFDGSYLVEANFAGADVSSSTFRGATLLGANLESADFSNTDIGDAEMDYGWWDDVALATYNVPPRGRPRIFMDGKEIKFGDDEYPDFEMIYQQRQAALEAMRKKRKRKQPARST